MIDIELQNDLDFSFDSKGDIKTIPSYESSLIIALFANRDKEIILDKKGGSNLYKLNQSRLVSDTINLYKFYANEALEYLYNSKLVADMQTKVKQDKQSSLILEVILNSINKDEVNKHEYKL